MDIKQELKEKYLDPEVKRMLSSLFRPSYFLPEDQANAIRELTIKSAEKLSAVFEANFDVIKNTLSKKVPDTHINAMLRLNFELLNNPTIKTLCGVQPICNPVDEVEFLEYTYGTDENGPTKVMSLDIGKDGVSVKSVPISDADASTIPENVGLDFFNAVGEHYNEVISHELLKLILHNADSTYDIDVSPKDPLVYGDICNLLIVKIAEAANVIARLTRRGSGNVVWVSPVVLSLMQMSTMSSFAPAPDEYDPRLVGILNKRTKVYVTSDPIMESKIIVGYVGASNRDAGIVMGQYIPVSIDDDDQLIAQHAFYSPENRMNHYAVINVTGSNLLP